MSCLHVGILVERLQSCNASTCRQSPYPSVFMSPEVLVLWSVSLMLHTMRAALCWRASNFFSAVITTESHEGRGRCVLQDGSCKLLVGHGFKLSGVNYYKYVIIDGTSRLLSLLLLYLLFINFNNRPSSYSAIIVIIMILLILTTAKKNTIITIGIQKHNVL